MGHFTQIRSNDGPSLRVTTACLQKVCKRITQHREVNDGEVALAKRTVFPSLPYVLLILNYVVKFETVKVRSRATRSRDVI